MQSLHVLGSKQFGGADRFYVRLIEALHDAGDEVTACNRPGSPAAKAPEGTGIPQLQLPLANKWDAWSRWQLQRWISRVQPDVVQTYMSRATRLTHVPKRSHTVHIARLGGYYKILGYYEHADAWVGNTRGICDYLIGEGLPSRRVFHIGNFVDTPETVKPDRIRKLRSRHGIPDDALVVFSLGRFIEKKGFTDLLQAFAALPKHSERPVFLVIAGDGPLRPDLEHVSAETEAGKRVRLVGWQYDLGPWFSMADVMVCPSRIEPLGNVILEAWSYGLPVLSTDTDGAKEICRNSVNACIVPRADHAAMSKALANLISEGSRTWQALGEAGRDEITRHHSREAVVANYQALYRDLKAQKKGR